MSTYFPILNDTGTNNKSLVCYCLSLFFIVRLIAIRFKSHRLQAPKNACTLNFFLYPVIESLRLLCLAGFVIIKRVLSNFFSTLYLVVRLEGPESSSSNNSLIRQLLCYVDLLYNYPARRTRIGNSIYYNYYLF